MRSIYVRAARRGHRELRSNTRESLRAHHLQKRKLLDRNSCCAIKIHGFPMQFSRTYRSLLMYHEVGIHK